MPLAPLSHLGMGDHCTLHGFATCKQASVVHSSDGFFSSLARLANIYEVSSSRVFDAICPCALAVAYVLLPIVQ